MPKRLAHVPGLAYPYFYLPSSVAVDFAWIQCVYLDIADTGAC